MSSSTYWKGKVFAITGASSGIGEALAREALTKDALVATLARRSERLQQLKSSVSSPQNLLTQQGDVTIPSDLGRWREEILKHWGRVDVVIANAGLGISGPFSKLSTDDYRRQFETNVFGVLETIRAFLPDLQATKGHLVVIGSVNSYISLGGGSAYAMSKFAVRALSESLYHELKDIGISVTLVCPGFVESEIRQVDNQGKLHAHLSDPVPCRFVMPRTKAARLILKATAHRKRELILTIHGYLGIYLKRYTPSFFHFVLDFFRIRGGKQKAMQSQ